MNENEKAIWNDSNRGKWQRKFREELYRPFYKDWQKGEG